MNSQQRDATQRYTTTGAKHSTSYYEQAALLPKSGSAPLQALSLPPSLRLLRFRLPNVDYPPACTVTTGSPAAVSLAWSENRYVSKANVRFDVQSVFRINHQYPL